MRRRPAVGDLRPHLTCRLCERYLTEATTTVKCLHSFCYGCIAAHLATSNSCPVCNKLLHPKRPLSKIRRDRILQRLVYKAIPGLLKRPEGNESGKEFEQEDSTEPLFSTSDYFSICLQQIRCRPETDYEMSIQRRNSSLFPFVSDNHEIEEPRYLFCSAIMTLKILKKFLCFKFSLTSRYEIGMMSCDQLFDEDHSLIDVAYISKWTMNDPLKIQYLILDKEKFAKSSENCWEACAAVVFPSGDPLPAPAAATSDEPRGSKHSPVDDHPATVEPSGADQTPRAPTESIAEAVPGAVEGNAGHKRLQRTAKSKTAFDSVSEKTVLEDRRFRVEPTANNTESLSASNTNSNGTEICTQNVRKESSRSRRRKKRKSDDVDVLVGGDAVRIAVTGAKRQAVCRASRQRHSEVVIPGVKPSPDAASKPPPEVASSSSSSIQSEQPLSLQNRGEGGVEMKDADGGSGVCSAPNPPCRVAPIKISLDCAQFISNFTDAVGRSSGQQKSYQLQRKDELRLQLSRKPSPSEMPPPRKKRKSGAGGKRSKNPAKTRRKLGGAPLAVPDQDAIVLNSFSIASEKNGLRSFGILPQNGGLDLEGQDIYPRSPYARKRRVPSITVTPSPVVFDTEISTYPYGKAAVDDRKVSRSPRKRTTATSGGKHPKVVSISTIPPTFVLTSSTMKADEGHGREKAVEGGGGGGGKPTSLKLYLKMTDDRKKTALQLHDAVDDCFMVSSTVADEEEYAGSGSSAEMSPDSAVNGQADELAAAAAAAAAAAKMADQPRCSTSAAAPVVTANFGSSLETVDPGSTDPVRIGASKEESPGSVYGNLFYGTRAAAAGTGTLSSSLSSGVPKDVGMKRRRLESVISSLKSVAVSTGHCQGGVLQSARPTVSHGTTTTAAVALPVFCPTPSVVRRLGPPGNRPRSILSQLVCREPLNIPRPPASTSRALPRRLPTPRTGIFTPTQLNHAVYGIRAKDPTFRNPPSAVAGGQRQCRPRAPRRPSVGAPPGGHLWRRPFDAGVRFQNHGLVVPMLPHWQLSDRQAVKPYPTSGTIQIAHQPPSEADGYDAPLELTTKRSRDSMV